MQKTIIITGANRGLGEAFVNQLINDDNCLVISISRSLSEDQKKYTKHNFLFIEADLSENDLNEKICILANHIKSETIYFISNASVIDSIVNIQDITNFSIDKSLSVNIKSVILITQYLLKNYNSKQLTFVNISSGAAIRPISNWSMYCSSKAYMQMFFNVAQTEYPKHKFFTIDPGVMDTGMQKILRESEFPEVEKFKNLQLEGKLKTPNEVAIEILKKIDI